MQSSFPIKCLTSSILAEFTLSRDTPSYALETDVRMSLYRKERLMTKVKHHTAAIGLALAPARWGRYARPSGVAGISGSASNCCSVSDLC